MTISQYLGILMLLGIALTLFGVTAHVMGWRQALYTWIGAIAGAALIVFAILLTTGSISIQHHNGDEDEALNENEAQCS